jgi:hypothetical protein
MKYHCVQCHRELKYTINEKKLDRLIFVCHYPDFPNYGLYQIPEENMPKDKPKKEEDETTKI